MQDAHQLLLSASQASEPQGHAQSNFVPAVAARLAVLVNCMDRRVSLQCIVSSHRLLMIVMYLIVFAAFLVF